jgi:hypothetical protein
LPDGDAEILRAWVEGDVYVWRLNSMRGYPADLAIENVSGRGIAWRHQRPLRPQSSLASRFTAGAAGFFVLSQCILCPHILRLGTKPTPEI